MAVTVLGTPTSFGGGIAGNTQTPAVAHTVGSGTGGGVSFIFVRTEGETINSMNTFGGVSPVLVGNLLDAGIYVYRAVSPAAGATTAQANLSAVSNAAGIAVLTLQGVDTTDPDDTPVTASVTELPVSATVTSATGDMVVGFALMVAADISANEGSTLATSQATLGEANRSIAVVYESGAASVTVGATSTESFGDNYMFAFNVNASGGGGGGGTIPVIVSYYNRLRSGNG